MSWLRLAVNKAVQASGKANLSRAVRTYADTVVNQAGQAVVGGSKLFQDRNVLINRLPSSDVGLR